MTSVAPDYDAKFPVKDAYHRAMELYALLLHSGLPDARWKIPSLYCDEDDVDYATFVSLAQLDMGDFVARGKSLYLYSPITGNGKTTWAIKLLISYYLKIYDGNAFEERGRFVNIPSFLRLVSESMNYRNSTDDIDMVKSALEHDDLIVMDDIASTPLNVPDQKYLLSYIDQRVLAGKATIYTGNCDEAQLERIIGKRLKSRVWNESIRCGLRGSDKRGEDL